MSVVKVTVHDKKTDKEVSLWYFHQHFWFTFSCYFVKKYIHFCFNSLYCPKKDIFIYSNNAPYKLINYYYKVINYDNN